MGDGNEVYIEEARRIILSFHQIKDYAVFLFGSRAEGSANERSDIDVGVFGKNALPALIKLEIEEKLEDSNIPLKVDLVDFQRADAAFKSEALKKIKIWNLPPDIRID